MKRKSTARKSMRSTLLSSMTVLGCALALPSIAGVQNVGAGSYADAPNPEGFGCVVDYGNWIFNAGVVEPGIPGCDPNLGPIGEPTPLYPHLTGPAANKPTGTHRWWGSVAFYGDMPVDDVSKSGYITPDPITARITDRGTRLLSIPGGLEYTNGNSDIYQAPDPFSEVFDGLAIGNAQFSTLDAKLYDYSDGTMTVEWQSNNQAVMRATFVHGSPYVFFDVLQGQLELRSKAITGPEKGIYYQNNNALGVWTDVAGNRATFLVTGEGTTSFSNLDAANMLVDNASGKITVALMPVIDVIPDQAMIDRHLQYALNRIDEMRIDHQVDSATQAVTITRHMLNQGAPVETLAGLQPLHWKNASSPISATDQIRSARGYTKFAPLSSFSYQLPFVGVLPTLPALQDSQQRETLRTLVQEFVQQGEAAWNTKSDTYWAGKDYGKVAELAAIAHMHGWNDLHTPLVNWLKAELEDWFNAETNGQLDALKYFSYDTEWNTLLGYEESFGAHQQLNDHHFHYGYFVRAAAEICRTDKNWCAPENYGSMIELLIRDYAADRNDPMFPYARNFDPANGFSWASGHANFALGNNNESTSEAANAYGAIVLYGLITGNEALMNQGIYLHASSTATYWEYWNNLDRYRNLGAPYDNFAPDYDKMTTSIIWGNGHVFSTWFSAAYAHILGIQGLPLNPLVMHIGQHPDYLKDYVTLGLSESSNGKPSGLGLDQWRDVWWNIWAMTDPEAAIADYATMNFNYDVEAGETKGHTYHWLHSFQSLGHLKTGTGLITADDPAALIFERNNQLTYIAYNYSDSPKLVSFSDGMAAAVPANSFRIKRTGDAPDTLTPDTEAPSQPTDIGVEALSSMSATLSWTASTDNIAVKDYWVTVNGSPTQSYQTWVPRVSLGGLLSDSTYIVDIVARDDAGNTSQAGRFSFTTLPSQSDLPPTIPALLQVRDVTSSQATAQWQASFDDVGVQHYSITLLEAGIASTFYTTSETSLLLPSLKADTAYSVLVAAVDTANQFSGSASVDFTTLPTPTCTDICLEENGDSLTFIVKTGVMVDVHFTVNNGPQMNIRMEKSGSEHRHTVNNLQTNDSVRYFFTIIDGPAYDTPWAEHTFGGAPLPADTQPPSQPGAITLANATATQLVLEWPASSDDRGVQFYEVVVNDSDLNQVSEARITLNNLNANTQYSIHVTAVDAAGNRSIERTALVSTTETPACDQVCTEVLDEDSLRVRVNAGGLADIHYKVNNGPQQNVRMQAHGQYHTYDIHGLSAGDRVDYFVTVIDGPAYDTPWAQVTF